MDMENYNSQMEWFTKVNLLMIISMEKERW